MPKRPAEVQDLDEEEEEEDYEDRRPRKSPKKNGNDNGRGKGKGKHREGVDDEDSDDEGLGGEDVHGAKAINFIQLNPAEKLQLKLDLRAMEAEARNMNNNVETTKSEDLIKNLRKGTSLFARVVNNDDAAFDSRTLRLNSDTASKLGKAAREQTNAFDLVGWFKPLKTLLGADLPADDEAEDDSDGNAPQVRKNGQLGDWEKIGWLAAKRTRRVMGMECMYGLMTIEHKKRVINRKAKQKGPVAGPEVRPTELVQADMNKGENETTKHVSAIDRLLEDLTEEYTAKDKHINYFKWIINPQSFAQTVENTFYTSFLIREGKAAMEFGPKGELWIMACDAPEKEDYEQNVRKRQAVIELTMQDWRAAIQKFNITESIIPHRQPKVVQPVMGSAWY